MVTSTIGKDEVSCRNYYSKIIGVQIQAGVIYMHMQYKDVWYIIWAELGHYSVFYLPIN